MDRRMRTIVVAAVVAMAALVIAASSASTPVWRVTSSDVAGETAVEDPPEETEPAQSAARERREVPEWVGTLAGIMGIMVAATLALALFALASSVMMPSLRRPFTRRGRGHTAHVLPEVDDVGLVVDVDAARTALAGGTPRNAIVACWMQLESDAESTGLARLASETSTEYVERVIAHSSVDPAPIAELAALYREARFSQHEMDDEHRDRAVAALDRVIAGLGIGATA